MSNSSDYLNKTISNQINNSTYTNSTNKTLEFSTNNYINNSIHEQDLNNQLNVLKMNDSKLVPYLQKSQKIDHIRPQRGNKITDGPFDSTHNDAYMQFLHDNGLLEDGVNKRRYRKNYINIDSRDRIKNNIVDADEEHVLSHNPLIFKINSKTLFVQHKDNTFQVGDKIQIKYVNSKYVHLRSVINNECIFSILPGSKIMKINYPHGLPNTYVGDYLYVEFFGIKDCFGNIPINILNRKHVIHVNVKPDINTNNNDFFCYSDNHFFIILPISLSTKINNIKTYNFKLNLHYIAGISVNLINNNNDTNIYHVIKYKNSEGYEIQLPLQALFNIKDGGNNVTVNKVRSIIYGSDNPNRYNINLGNTYNNIVSVRMISSLFPKRGAGIEIINNAENANNKLYWNNIDDGNYLYNIEIANGNYTLPELITAIETAVSKVKYINKDINHSMKITWDVPTDKITFYSFKRVTLVQPIIKITPPIIDAAVSQSYMLETDIEYELTINHPNHNLNVNDKICFTGAVTCMGIPDTVLNNEHVICDIIDNNTYIIKLAKHSFYLKKKRLNTRGGFCVNVLIPNVFRLRFDENDTLALPFGFRNPGCSNSVFPFNTQISNQDLYENEVIFDKLDKLDKLNKYRALQLYANDYIYMVANPFVTITGTSQSPIKHAFAKILLRDNTNTGVNTTIVNNMLCNTFVPSEKIYEDPLRKISRLEVAFFSPDGKPHDFYGLEHSYVIEVTTVNDIPDGSGFNPNTGQNYNEHV